MASEKIQKLEEENKKLRENYQFFKSQIITVSALEVKALEAEKKKLEEEKLMLLDMVGNRFASVPCVPEMEYQRVCEENEKLKEKNEELQEEFDGWKASYDDDIRELEGNLADATKQMEDAIFSAALMLGKIKKLKKVLKELETTSD